MSLSLLIAGGSAFGAHAADPTLSAGAAAGFSFGENGRYELAALVHHVSNANIKQPNVGLTYGGIRFRVALP